ncbi:arginine--tRNA ligase [Phormidium tenue]|uniref:Arginine--tRNA ligase n=1 Tax=Phormidium tenue NIES-30 TaxID=549789 RepID=A0A1U7J7C7_9CYAN|nr:arginine--tRNA ligase [Phormidium tenue]MBD2231612.1 arginine--tRNA ligase [Phormidium tenue FACHB-1052]OKH49012.1 arginine--tRNA ligase [Phormidium tenue NIES-30]
MKSTLAQLTARFDQALVAAFGADLAGTDPMLVATSNPKFGDYQANLAMSLAKPLKGNPRAIAAQIVEQLDISDLCEPPEIAGPGFINLRFKTAYLEDQLRAMQADPRLGVEPVKTPQKVIVDFSSPNIAKEMHVGHLRSTIIGDSIARVQEFMGNDVLRLNHVGDWGTQFGMLITHLKEACPEALEADSKVDIGDLVAFYKQAKKRFDDDDNFRTRSREAVVGLQAGDAIATKAWQTLCNQSRHEFQKLYDRLDIQIQERGESFYNPLLADVVKDLASLGLLVEDQGAKVVFADGFTNKDGDPLPLIIQKTDGGYNYATTDLAAIRYRTQQDGAERVLYVVDAGQGSHFAQVFQVAAKAGWIPDGVELTHVPFGVVQGEDGKKFKTRSGDTVKLKDLLDEAVSRARTDLESRIQAEERQETEEFIQDVAEAVGLGAVKYADLSQNRTSNYIFSFDKMLALAGNTAPYMLYAYVRVQGISRKGDIDFDHLPAEARIHLEDDSEFALARHLLQLDEVLEEVAQDLYPSRLCQYLFELSQKFNQFYDRCSVLQAAEPQRTSRLLLCDLTAKTLNLGLSLLGIRVLERM